MTTRAHAVSLLGAGALAVLGVGCSADHAPARLRQEPASAAVALVWAEASSALIEGGEVVGAGIVCAATCAEVAVGVTVVAIVGGVAYFLYDHTGDRAALPPERIERFNLDMAWMTGASYCPAIGTVALNRLNVRYDGCVAGGGGAACKVRTWNDALLTQTCESGGGGDACSSDAHIDQAEAQAEAEGAAQCDGDAQCCLEDEGANAAADDPTEVEVREVGTNSDGPRGTVRGTIKNVEATSASTGEKTTVDYEFDANFQVSNAPTTAESGALVFEKILELSGIRLAPAGSAFSGYNYDLRPGAAAMKQLIEAIAQAMAKKMPGDVHKLRIKRYRATQGYQGCRTREKDYDMDRFR